MLGHVANGYLEGSTYPEANHGLFCIYNAIYAFHMPLFMMISGYVYAVAYFDSVNVPNREKIYRQTANIAIVYVLFSVLFGLLKLVLSRYTYNPVEFTDILLIWCRPISPYWYLYDLMLLYLLFSVLALHSADGRLMICILATAAFLSGYVLFNCFQVSNVLYYALFFYIGFRGKSYPKLLTGNKRAALGAATMSIILCFLFWDKGPYTVREKAVFLNSIPVANVFIAIGISLMLWYLFQNVKWLAKNRFLALLGRHSLEIYVIHCYFTTGFRAVFPMIGVNDPFVSVLLNFVLSTVFSLAGAYICKLIGIHELVFKPVNYINCLKSKRP